MNSIYIYYIVVVWFLFIAVTGFKKYPSATILFLAALINLIAVHALGLFEPLTYLEANFILIRYDGALGIIMTMIMTIDKHAKKHALILGFAVVCHSMIELYYVTDSSKVESVAFLFHKYYDELIILTALLQMWVSRDGMAQGLNNTFRHVQRLLFGRIIFDNHNYKRIFTRKERES